MNAGSLVGSSVDLIPAKQTERWHEVLERVPLSDFYHLPDYHLVAEQSHEGEGILFVYREGDRLAAWPFLLRPIEDVPEMGQAGGGLKDGTSVYGYPGPLCSAQAADDEQFVERVGRALAGVASEMKLVSLFSRLNPLLDNVRLTTGIGTSVPMGETVLIDLSNSPEEQWLGYRKGRRYEILRARRLGVSVSRDVQWAAFEEFYRMYVNTMTRVGAAKRYYFQRDYFLNLKNALGDRLQLFTASYDGVVCAASLFVHNGAIIQYHLSGSDPLFSHLSPSKVIVDEARVWGNQIGAKSLHLGGGVGSQRDSLFNFKAGYSGNFLKFFVWRHIVLPEIYESLVNLRAVRVARTGRDLATADFFPAYRADESD